MRTSHICSHVSLIALIMVICALTVSIKAADPGMVMPVDSALSDQKAGSILVYNVYTSSVTNFLSQNSRISLTNTSDTTQSNVHLFFVDGASCSVADSYACLTQNQTMSFLASDLDPGITGFLVVVAVDGLGCPTNHNFLIGDTYTKFASGHRGNLAAVAITAQFTTFTGCNASSVTAALVFDAPATPNSYNYLPRVLAASSIPDRATGNDTLLVLNRIGGNLGTGVGGLGSLAGILYDDGENAFSFTLTTSSCQIRSSLTNNFPRTAPRFETIIPAGRSGWMKLYADATNFGLLGATFNNNANSAALATAFNGSRNLHALTLNNAGTAVSFTIPVFPPSC
ncbi:MAG: hypothetical protein ACKVZH_16465 [Blastocatellia bacterium]